MRSGSLFKSQFTSLQMSLFMIFHEREKVMKSFFEFRTP